MSLSQELENYLLENEHLSTITLRTYKLNYEKLTDLLNSDTINDVPQTEIINVVQKQIQNPNSKIMLINVAMNIKKHLKNRVELLSKYRETLKLDINQAKNVRKDIKKDSVVSYNDLFKYLNKLYVDEEWRAYIINYLLIHFNVRNRDLDLLIVEDKSDFTAFGSKGDENVVYVGSKNLYYRNNYKTVKMYEPKKNGFNSRKFSRAVEKFIAQQNSENGISYLLSDKNNNRIGSDSLGNFIKKYTLNKMNESDYNKISVSRVKSLDDYKLLQTISKNRGTAIETLISDYNLNVKLDE